MSSNNYVNITYDDFDPLIKYADLTQWTTPNPQDNPTWYRQGEGVTGVPWHEATLHYTSVQGAELSFNFTASQIWIYGSLNASSPSYSITLDGSKSDQSPSSVPNGRALLYSSTELSNSPHQLTLTNNNNADVGGGLGARLGGVGIRSRFRNRDAFNGTSTYTHGPGNSFEFSVAASGIWLYGDTVQDHGPFSVFINDSSTPYGTWNARTPCGGPEVWAKQCEKLGALKAFVGPLGEGTHKVKVVNGGPDGDEATYFDFDYVEYTIPSTYPSFIIDATGAVLSGGNSSDSSSGSGSGGSATSSNALGSGSGSGSASAAPSSTGGSGGTSAALSSYGVSSPLVWGLLGIWTLKKLGLDRL
ncbi:hypothetical protein I316_07202 [Kwoniella heveanensis BCC8398]|uniref:Uncharacterized protein n=1 Tax=Kwoniella heveanensis BCC8398 TaxID=1296120 RepID=A0A1B9GJS2_9TREE|nr:hypothetical protein I316_07202 [Kwoniella heveanensis BCC8398]